MTNNNTVEPADTARTACYRAVLMTFLTNPIADLIVQLRRERAVADTSRIRFRYADDLLDLRRADAGTDTNAASCRVGGSYVRIRALVDIQHDALRTFEQHLLAAVDRIVQYDGVSVT